MDCAAPLHVHDERFCVRAYESGVNNQVTLPALCNFLQEAAGNHARRLGLGIHELQDVGFTWMLARLHLVIRRYAAWRETVLLGVSEWLYVEVPAQRIVRLPQAFAALAPAGTPQVPLPEAPAKLPDIPAPEWSAAITVRHSDHDFNNHVNNAHYVAWALECLPDT